MRIGKSRCIELNQTRCCTRKFNMALSMCGVLEVTLYFSKGFLEAAARVSAVAGAPQLLGETMVCFLGQESSLEERSTHRVLGCFLGAGDGDDLKEEFLVDEAARDEFALFWGAIAEPEVEAFPCF